ncbi:endonuclease I family protein [Halobacteriovorax sp. HLS]|uniref:endonuclease I family protein n=1 Tax=Halobacteriovorax sp. HLS TaxID=2234000 RepID=UPI000FD8CAEC|nr:endonuclease [Halobacteriovorax sp. HLS]
MKFAASLLVLLVSINTFASSNYYPQKYVTGLEEGTLRGAELKESLFKILTSSHQKSNNGRDKLGCSSSSNGRCYQYKVLGYKGARKVLFGKLHLEESSNGYYVKDVYCRKEITNRDTKIGPNLIPNSNIMNCEHTWPQSKFTNKFDNETQKSDLHHLYPTDSRANSIRGNYDFSNVGSGELNNCEASRSEGHGGKFEPPTEHKGNVARALFYFSVRYQIEINAQQEKVLRQWHNQDPVDAEEMERNEGIYTVQQNRNPFIDFPHLVDSIQNF